MEVHCRRCNAAIRPTALFCDQCSEPIRNRDSDGALVALTQRPATLPEQPAPRSPAAPSSDTRPPGMPEAQPARQLADHAAEPDSAQPSDSANPSGVAWEPGSPLSHGRPTALPEPQAVAVRPKWAAQGDQVVGEARHVVPRSEGSLAIWTFRIERYDASGNRLPPVPVEMRNYSFQGSLSDGDWVEADAQWKPGQVLRPHQVRNLTTGVLFSASMPLPSKLAVAVAWIVFVPFVPAILFFVALALYILFVVFRSR